MKAKFLTSSLSVAALLFSANSFAMEKNSGFQVAVIEHAVGSKELLTGKYQKGLDKISKAASRRHSKFNLAMGLCAAKLMVRDLEQADQSCSEAISVANERFSDHNKHLNAIAYSNRAITRFLKGDTPAAEKDMNTAAMIDNNNIVKANFAALRTRLIVSDGVQDLLIHD